jgi:hypothetical protein
LAYDWDHQSKIDTLLAADELETERLLDRVELEEKVKEYNASLQELRYKILNSSFFIRILF